MAWGDDTRDQWTETLYSFRPTVLNNLIVSKWKGGKQPVETYVISMMGKGKCNCMGAIRQPYCRHRKMVDRVTQIVGSQNLGSAAGCYYDFDRDLLYCPADGEGIPLDTKWMEQVVEAAKV